MSELKDSLQERSRKAIFQHAIFRWESAAMIAFTLIGTGVAFIMGGAGTIPSWSWMVALALGSGAELGLIFSSLRDVDANAEAVRQMLQAEFKPEDIKHQKLRGHVKQALDYRARINAAIDNRADSPLKTQLMQTAVEMDDWIENVYSLASRIDNYLQQRQTLKRDYQNAKRRLDQLQKKRIEASDPAVLDQIDRNMESLQRQIGTIDKLGATMDRAHLQLEHTLSSLGTIYSQTMLAGAKDIDNARAKRLQHEVHEEIVELNDVLESMDEVYALS